MARNVRQIVRYGLQIYPTVHSLSGRRVKDRSGPFAKGRNPPGNGEENLPSPTDCAFPSHRHVFARRTVAARSRGQARYGTRRMPAVHAIKLHVISFCRDRKAWDRRFIPNAFASRHAKTIAPWPPNAQSPLGRSFGGLSFSGMPSRNLLRRSPGQSSRQRAPPHGARAHRRGRTRRPRPPCPSKTS